MTDTHLPITTDQTAARPGGCRRCPWRDHGRVLRPDVARTSPVAPAEIDAIIPIEGNASDRLGEVSAAVAGIADLCGAARVEDGGVHVRFCPGHCPIPAIDDALAPFGLRLAPDRCVHLNEASAVPLSISARRHRRWTALPGKIASLAAANLDISLVLLGGLFVLAGFITHAVGGSESLRWALLLVSVPLTSRHTAADLLESVREFRLNIDILMFGAAIGAAAIGHVEEGAFLLFLFGLGAAGESAAMSRARREIAALGALAPEEADVVGENGEVVTRRVTDIAPDEVIVVRAFDRVPLDGVVIEGVSAIDESTLTGESIPVDKRPGATVFAGTMNAGGALRVRVTKRSGDTTIDRIIHMVSEARQSRSHAQRITERIEAWYVPLVLVITGLLVVAPPLLTTLTWSEGFYRAMAFMTAASPCALAIGVPAATLCGIARAARLGVLFKGGEPLESLSRIRAIALDKTGTLTHGTPEVNGVHANGGMTEDELLAVAAAVEAGANHPIATAIVNAAESRGLSVPVATNLHQAAGRGVEASLDGRRITVAKPPADVPDAWPTSLRDAAIEARNRGDTLVLVSRDDEAVGLITLADAVQAGAADAVARLRAMRIERIVMLTGDHEAAARTVAAAVGIDAADVRADLTPEDKLRIIGDLDDASGAAAMVGDGVNDAPALARASIGVAMGAAGADVAMETADVALMGRRIERLPDAIGLARATHAMVLQNLVIALGVIAIVAPLGALGFANLGVAVLLHEGSTVLVVVNSLRLLRFGGQSASSRAA